MTDKLFTLGPVEMYEYTRERPTGQLPYFRTEEYSGVNLECAKRLKRLSGAADDSHVFLLTCSGTGAMEAVVGGCFCAKDRLLTIDGGGFGHRFMELAAHHGIPHEAVSLKFGEALTAGALEAAAESASGHSGDGSAGGFTGLLVNLHETTTGQLYDKDMLSSFCRAHGLYFVCDAVGSFLADPLDFEKDGVDALIISSHKALALPPGLAVIIMSDRLYKKTIEQDIRPFSLYFDFRDAEANAVRGQTPFTPAIGTVLALRERLQRLEEEGGAEAAVSRTKALAEDFRGRIKGLIEKGLVAMPAHPLSNACTPLVFAGGGAKAAYVRLSREHGVWLNPNGGELADTVLRTGHLGNLTIDDNKMLAGLLEDIL
ncbi:MAG: aminotransferase class V-fold PLP-dependent enzyme [Clostridiales bacterium]|nr:aminotransferase class V-fold PLP-dependent enzyme [Clostridiales bacterium]